MGYRGGKGVCVLLLEVLGMGYGDRRGGCIIIRGIRGY